MFAFPFLRHTGAGFGGGGQDGRHRLAPSLQRQQNRTQQQTVRPDGSSRISASLSSCSAPVSCPVTFACHDARRAAVSSGVRAVARSK